MKKTILFLLLLTLCGCEQSEKVTVAEAEVVKEADSRTGMVLETIGVDSYTYIRLDKDGQEVWLAVTPITLSKGELVRYSGASMMLNFHSRTLDRTFPEILFVASVERMAENDTTMSTSLVTTPDVADLHKTKATTSVVDADPVSVERLESGKTIAEIIAEREQIEGQEVSLRAKVTKFSANILGKNWITLQDGSGMAQNNKLVVTTTWTVAVGDVAVVIGKVKNNVDIGAGYKYEVLLEDATFSQ